MNPIDDYSIAGECFRWVTQTILASEDEGAEKGNCFAACVASLLRLPITEVPNFANDAYGWPQNFYAWLRDRGMGYLWLIVKDEHGAAARLEDLPLQLQSMGAVGLHLIYGTSPRGHLHSCIGDGGVLVHDPHPSRAGLSDINGVGFIFPLDAGTPISRIADLESQVQFERTTRSIVERFDESGAQHFYGYDVTLEDGREFTFTVAVKDGKSVVERIRELESRISELEAQRTELQAANTREVERRREAEADLQKESELVAYFRKKAKPRPCIACGHVPLVVHAASGDVTADSAGRHTGDNAHDCCRHDPNIECCDIARDDLSRVRRGREVSE